MLNSSWKQQLNKHVSLYLKMKRLRGTEWLFMCWCVVERPYSLTHWLGWFFCSQEMEGFEPLMSSPHATAVIVVTVSSYNNGMRLVL